MPRIWGRHDMASLQAGAGGVLACARSPPLEVPPWGYLIGGGEGKGVPGGNRRGGRSGTGAAGRSAATGRGAGAGKDEHTTVGPVGFLLSFL